MCEKRDIGPFCLGTLLQEIGRLVDYEYCFPAASLCGAAR